MTTKTLTITEIHEINRLSWHEQKSSTEIAELLHLNADDCEAVVRGRYVEHVRADFIPDAAITLHQYNELRRRYKAKDALNNEYALAVEFLIDPKSVLKIVRSQFQNANTHPVTVAQAAKHSTGEAGLRAAVTDAEVKAARTLLRNSWKQSDVAERTGWASAVVAVLARLHARSWLDSDIAIELNRRFHVEPLAEVN